MFFPRDDMILMVREQDLDDIIRRPIARPEARKVLQHISSFDGKASKQWKTRANANQAKLDDGDPFALAEVYKSLAVRRDEDVLSAADRKQLSRSEQYLSEELAVALNGSQEQALARMEKAAHS